jgi:hypothetical protein
MDWEVGAGRGEEKVWEMGGRGKDMFGGLPAFGLLDNQIDARGPFLITWIPSLIS